MRLSKCCDSYTEKRENRVCIECGQFCKTYETDVMKRASEFMLLIIIFFLSGLLLFMFIINQQNI